MKLQIIAAVLIWTVFSQIDHTPIPPLVVSVNITPKTQSVPRQHSFKQVYSELAFQISGQVFESDQQLPPEQIYNSSAYSSSQSCDFYNSQISADVIANTIITNNSIIESSYISKTKKMIFLLVSNDNYDVDQNTTDRSILFYTFDNQAINLINLHIPIAEIGLNSTQKLPISFAQNNNVLLVTDGVQIGGINIDNLGQWWKIQQLSSSTLLPIDYQFASSNRLLKFQIMHSGQNGHLTTLTIAWNLIIKVFSVSSDTRSVTLLQQLTPPNNYTQFYDVICEYGIFYGLVQNQLVVYRPVNQILTASAIQLESSECFLMHKYETTIHIICKEAGINYVAELFFNASFVHVSEALKLNRYYTYIGDANGLYKIGGWQNPKLVISGGDQLLITPYAVNRQVLLEAKSPQVSKRFRGLSVLGINQIEYIDNISTFRSAIVIAIGVEFISILNFREEPAQIDCYSENKSSANWNVLVQINTTSCLANGDIEQLQSICQISIPYIYQFTSFEVQSSKQTSVTLLVLTILGVIVIVLLGLAFHCKTLRTKAINQVKKKLAKLQKNTSGPKRI